MMHCSNLSFREKSAWVSLSILLIVYVPYFIYVRALVRAGQLNLATAIGIFTAAVFFQIVLAIVATIAISVRARIDPKDERDAAIEAKAFRNAYVVLTFGICLAGMFVTLAGLSQNVSALARAKAGSDFVRDIGALLSPAAATQILLLCLVTAEATKYATQVFCYRRGS